MRILIFGFALLLCACSSEENEVTVSHAGSLHELMQGRIGARVSLDSLCATAKAMAARGRESDLTRDRAIFTLWAPWKIYQAKSRFWMDPSIIHG